MALCQACLTPQRSAPASWDPSCHGSFLSTKTAPTPPLSATQRRCLSFRSQLSHLPHPPVPHALAAPALDPVAQIFANQSSKFADILGSISSLYSEVGEERRVADEYVQRTAEESGRSTEDYERRALLFERSGEMVASSKLKGERVIMELELLQGEVLESDEGRTAADYLRRSQIFSKSAEVFANQFFTNQALP